MEEHGSLATLLHMSPLPHSVILVSNAKVNQEAEPVTEQICLLKLAEPLSVLKTYDLSDARW